VTIYFWFYYIILQTIIIPCLYTIGTLYDFRIRMIRTPPPPHSIPVYFKVDCNFTHKRRSENLSKSHGGTPQNLATGTGVRKYAWSQICMYIQMFILSYISFFFCFLGVGWGWVHLVRPPLTDLLCHPRMIVDECVAVGEMRISRGNRITRRKTALMPLCPPQIPHDLTWPRTWVATVGCQQLTAWAIARLTYVILRIVHIYISVQ
jgi:hypothetical protein